MHGPYYILPLFVLLIASSICEQHRPPDVDGASFVSTEGVDWHRTNSMSLESREEYGDIQSSGDGFLDRTTISQDSVRGSGDGPGASSSEDDERDFGRGEEEGSGVELGSGNFPVSGLTPCQQSAVEAEESRASNYVPRCNKKGEFAARQCDRNSADCWCVNLSGVEVPGSRRTHPATARCKDQYTFIVDGKSGGNAQPDVVDTPSPVETTDGFIIENKKEDNEPNADISTINAQPGDLETKQPISRPSIIGKPGMLAGIICAAVVGLLCAVLLVMFIVYRMRKKDEGSYALDQPKRSPSLTYTKATKDNREFFA